MERMKQSKGDTFSLRSEDSMNNFTMNRGYTEGFRGVGEDVVHGCEEEMEKGIYVGIRIRPVIKSTRSSATSVKNIDYFSPKDTRNIVPLMVRASENTIEYGRTGMNLHYPTSERPTSTLTPRGTGRTFSGSTMRLSSRSMGSFPFSQVISQVNGDESSLHMSERQHPSALEEISANRFVYDKVFDVNATQHDVMEVVGRRALQRVLKGYNGSVVCYGQSGSGKTYTMLGAKGGTSLFRSSTNSSSKGRLCLTMDEGSDNGEGKGVLRLDMRETQEEIGGASLNLGEVWNTGSSMAFGDSVKDGEDIGLIPRLLHGLFTELEAKNGGPLFCNECDTMTEVAASSSSPNPSPNERVEGMKNIDIEENGMEELLINSANGVSKSNESSCDAKKRKLRWSCAVEISAIELHKEEIRDLLPFALPFEDRGDTSSNAKLQKKVSSSSSREIHVDPCTPNGGKENKEGQEFVEITAEGKVNMDVLVRNERGKEEENVVDTGSGRDSGKSGSSVCEDENEKDGIISLLPAPSSPSLVVSRLRVSEDEPFRASNGTTEEESSTDQRESATQNNNNNHIEGDEENGTLVGNTVEAESVKDSSHVPKLPDNVLPLKPAVPSLPPDISLPCMLPSSSSSCCLSSVTKTEVNEEQSLTEEHPMKEKRQSMKEDMKGKKSKRDFNEKERTGKEGGSGVPHRRAQSSTAAALSKSALRKKGQQVYPHAPSLVPPLRIRHLTEAQSKEAGGCSVWVEGLRRHRVYSFEEAYTVVKCAAHARKVAETKLNARSSRSHTLFFVYVLQQEEMPADEVPTFQGGKDIFSDKSSVMPHPTDREMVNQGKEMNAVVGPSLMGSESSLSRYSKETKPGEEGYLSKVKKAAEEMESDAEKGVKERNRAEVQEDGENGKIGSIMQVKYSVLTLADLAGSERVSHTGAEGARLEEAKKINLSLTILGSVIQKLVMLNVSPSGIPRLPLKKNSSFLTSSSKPRPVIGGAGSVKKVRTPLTITACARTKTNKPMGKESNDPMVREPSTHIPYRDSILTQLLQNSFGGNSVTFLLCTISLEEENRTETLSTLRFGQLAKSVKNKATSNTLVAHTGDQKSKDFSYSKLFQRLLSAYDHIAFLENQLKAASLQLAAQQSSLLLSYSSVAQPTPSPRPSSAPLLPCSSSSLCETSFAAYVPVESADRLGEEEVKGLNPHPGDLTISPTNDAVTPVLSPILHSLTSFSSASLPIDRSARKAPSVTGRREGSDGEGTVECGRNASLTPISTLSFSGENASPLSSCAPTSILVANEAAMNCTTPDNHLLDARTEGLTEDILQVDGKTVSSMKMDDGGSQVLQQETHTGALNLSEAAALGGQDPIVSNDTRSPQPCSPVFDASTLHVRIAEEGTEERDEEGGRRSNAVVSPTPKELARMSVPAALSPTGSTASPNSTSTVEPNQRWGENEENADSRGSERGISLSRENNEPEMHGESEGRHECQLNELTSENLLKLDAGGREGSGESLQDSLSISSSSSDSLFTIWPQDSDSDIHVCLTCYVCRYNARTSTASPLGTCDLNEEEEERTNERDHSSPIPSPVEDQDKKKVKNPLKLLQFLVLLGAAIAKLDDKTLNY